MLAKVVLCAAAVTSGGSSTGCIEIGRSSNSSSVQALSALCGIAAMSNTSIEETRLRRFETAGS
jgi:hypothetical protein